MKKTGLLLGIFLIISGFSFQLATAQEKTKEEQEKELQILKEIDQQKKEMAEQNNTKETNEKKKEITEKKKQMPKQKEITFSIGADLEDMEDELDSNLDDLEDLDIDLEDMDNFRNGFRIYNNRGHRQFQFPEPFVISAGTDNYFNASFGDNAERSEWDFSKSVVDNTFSSEYTFDVEKTVNSVVMSVRGDCKAGEIRIIITTPDGENYSDLVIDEFGNLNWRKSFNISETENQDKTGEWNFKIESNKATGYFSISLHTF
jgi:hypothetical protein